MYCKLLLQFTSYSGRRLFNIKNFKYREYDLSREIMVKRKG